MSLGQRIKLLREKNGLTQLKASELLNVSNKALSRYENNDANPDPDVIANMARLYNSTSDYILGLSTNESSNKTNESEADDFLVAFNDIGDYQELDEQQKEMIRTMIKAFKEQNSKK